MKNLIVIPAFNEEAALPHTLASLQNLNDNYEILIIDDGSEDRTGTVIQEFTSSSKLAVHTLRLPLNSGIGVAMQASFMFAAQQNSYEYLVQYDADGQHDAGAITTLVEHCRENDLDLCVGSRFLQACDQGFKSSKLRRIGIRFLAGLINRLSSIHITDPTSGFRCLSRRLWSNFANYYPDDYPEPESLFWSARNQFKIGELPVQMFERQGGQSSIRTLDGAYYMLKVSLAILIGRIRKKERL